MKAMILAAGKGIRLRPYTNQIPKCMISIAGKPILEHIIEWLKKHEIKEIIINLHYLPELIKDYFSEGKKWGVKIYYSYEEHLLGTAGGVKNVESFFDGPFLVWYGDNLSTCNLNKLYQFHKAKGGLGTIVLHQREEVRHSGVVRLDGDDRIIFFQEKPKSEKVLSNWVNAGIYLFEQKVLNYIYPDKILDFGQDVFPYLLGRGERLYGYRLSHEEGFWWIDRPEDLKRVLKEWG